MPEMPEMPEMEDADVAEPPVVDDVDNVDDGGRWAAAARPAAVAGALLAAYLVLHLVAAGEDPYGWEHDLVELSTRIPGPIGDPMQVVMDMANRMLLPFYALVGWLVSRRPAVALAVLAAGLVEGFGIDALKEWAERPRPTGVRLRDHVGGFGLPSGHTAFACAVAVVIASQLRGWWRVVPLGLAAVVGLARMHVGVHYPLDVVGGALYGGGVACAALALLAAASPQAPGQNAAHG